MDFLERHLVVVVLLVPAADNLHGVAAVGTDHQPSVAGHDFLFQLRNDAGDDVPVVPRVADDGEEALRIYLGQQSAVGVEFGVLASGAHHTVLSGRHRTGYQLLLRIGIVVFLQRTDGGYGL